MEDYLECTHRNKEEENLSFVHNLEINSVHISVKNFSHNFVHGNIYIFRIFNINGIILPLQLSIPLFKQ